jgi:coenzyme F420 biosynthesis associated uncharacterized protein
VSERVLVDWGLAERVAGAVAGSGEHGSGATAAAFEPGAVREACREALAVTRAHTGLDPGVTPEAEVIGRGEWTRAGIRTLRDAASEIEAQVASQISLPGPLGPAARRIAGTAAGAEAGVAVGYAARRVLGQYDVAVAGPKRPSRLLFVGPNLAAVRAQLYAETRPFLLWITAHEITHALQFGGVPWLTDHIRSLVAELIELAGREFDTRELAGRLLRSDPRHLVRSALRGELVRVLADDEQRRAFDRLQATMSAIEGHAEHVAEVCAAQLDPGSAAVQQRAEERRQRRGGLGEAIGRLLGMELKLRQYRLGKAFCDEVVRRGGAAALRKLWTAPVALPSMRELEHPEDWLERVTALSPAAA